jgi:O-antigen/teichoic acid export membrane protein
MAAGTRPAIQTNQIRDDLQTDDAANPMTQSDDAEATDNSTLRRLLRNAGYLLGSRVLRDGMGLVALALVARHLGPGGFGVIALLQSYTFTINWLVNFQTWQAIVRYGAELEGEDQRPGLRGLLRLSLLLDAGTALLGGVLGWALAGWIGQLWGWDAETVRLARWYCLLVIVPDWTGTWTGILRLFDRFGVMSAQGIAASTIKLVGAIVGITGHWQISDFVWLWMIAEATSLVIAALLALWVALGEGVVFGPAATPRAVLHAHPGLLGFFVSTNWHTTVRMASKEVDTLIIGGILGNASAGLYKIVKQIASVLSRAADPLYQAVYPELAKLWSAGDHAGFRRLLRKSTWMGLAAGLGFLAVFCLTGRWVLVTLLGGDYAEAYEPTQIYLAAVAVQATTFAFHPAALAMDKPADSLYVLLAVTGVYFALLVPAIQLWSLQGAAAAYVVFYVVWALVIGWRLKGWMRQV